jgi:hypothetical protein
MGVLCEGRVCGVVGVRAAFAGLVFFKASLLFLGRKRGTRNLHHFERDKDEKSTK